MGDDSGRTRVARPWLGASAPLQWANNASGQRKLHPPGMGCDQARMPISIEGFRSEWPNFQPAEHAGRLMATRRNRPNEYGTRMLREEHVLCPIRGRPSIRRKRAHPVFRCPWQFLRVPRLRAHGRAGRGPAGSSLLTIVFKPDRLWFFEAINKTPPDAGCQTRMFRRRMSGGARPAEPVMRA